MKNKVVIIVIVLVFFIGAVLGVVYLDKVNEKKKKETPLTEEEIYKQSLDQAVEEYKKYADGPSLEDYYNAHPEENPNNEE